MKVGITGCSGRMAKRVIRAATERGDCQIVAGFARRGSQAVGCDLGTLAGIAALGVKATDDPRLLFQAADVVVDFTHPCMLQLHLEQAVGNCKPLVVGTTALSAHHEQAMLDSAKNIPVVYAPNTSLGINVLLDVVAQLSGILTPQGFDIAIVDQHHKHKLDAPSGTALALQRAAGVRADRGGVQRESALLPAVVSLRIGEVVGDHTVILAGPGERVELTHRASDPMIFARGALLAARWLLQQSSGLYSMRQVLGLGIGNHG